MKTRNASSPTRKSETRPMTETRIARGLKLSVCALAALAASSFANPASAGEIDPNGLMTSAAGGVVKNLQLGAGKSVIVDLPEDASEIYVGDPTVANAIVRSARRVYISGVANGQTSIFALGKDGRKIAIVDVSVGRDVAELTSLLNVAIPGNDIHIRTVSDSIILTGSVGSAGDAQKALDIAQGFVGSGASSQTGDGKGGTVTTKKDAGKVINSLTIRNLDQVSLRVTITEIRRQIVKQLGVNLSGTGSQGSGFTVENPFAINGTLTNTAANIAWTSGGTAMLAQLQAFERDGVAHTLAEPTVTAVSGESAKFLAGGTIPIPNGENCSDGVCQLSIVQQAYGVTLNFTPVVLSQGRIQLRIATEVTDIDNSEQITIAGTSVPGFRTRKNETTVELPSGGSIASAGLISTETQQAVNGVPGLMNMPVLGALFRSRDFQRNETELLIIVTPYIVHAIDPNEVVRPDQNFHEASDPQAWLLGRVNRIYSTAGNLRPMPNYSAKIGFITD
jgi:pilus assembly protein CpaC